MAYELPTLPWTRDALAPNMTPETIDFHYGKHHNAYVVKLNGLVAGTAYEPLSLEETIRKAHTEGNKAVYNNAAQHFNHSFLWNCLTPNSAPPSGKVADALQSFGGYEAFKAAFTHEAVNHFGSGWTWLIRDVSGVLKITSTHDADTPLAYGQKPILTCDVWEHAYYIDHRNARPAWLEAFFRMANWDFVAQNLV